jgi:hypothetical protein
MEGKLGLSSAYPLRGPETDALKILMKPNSDNFSRFMTLAILIPF